MITAKVRSSRCTINLGPADSLKVLPWLVPVKLTLAEFKPGYSTVDLGGKNSLKPAFKLVFLRIKYLLNLDAWELCQCINSINVGLTSAEY